MPIDYAATRALVRGDLGAALNYAWQAHGQAWFADDAAEDATRNSLKAADSLFAKLGLDYEMYVLSGTWTHEKWLSAAALCRQQIAGVLADIGASEWSFGNAWEHIALPTIEDAKEGVDVGGGVAREVGAYVLTGLLLVLAIVILK